jgi:hypothetical protein
MAAAPARTVRRVVDAVMNCPFSHQAFQILVLSKADVLGAEQARRCSSGTHMISSSAIHLSPFETPTNASGSGSQMGASIGADIVTLFFTLGRSCILAYQAWSASHSSGTGICNACSMLGSITSMWSYGVPATVQLLATS